MPRAVASLGPCKWIGVPFHSISPLLGSQIPEMVLISVDLPAPLSPTRAVTWPSGMSRSTPASACTGPKLLPTLRRLSSMTRPPGPRYTGRLKRCRHWLAPRPWLAPGPRSRAGRHIRRSLSPPPKSGSGSSAHDHPVIPAAVQAALNVAVHSCAAGTKLSVITVEFMLAGVTHSGVSSTEGTWTCSAESVVVLLTRLAGGVALARMYIASAAAA